ncbi:MAG TPA: metallophosphoesterase family protein [Candidatus Eremiobacteraceae bacterium]|nr:metallophosphoesterase family protein [Candidatus Eremiobacteraceae bacterium]
MRIAIVSDIHGNLTAFEAVLADLTKAAPDLIFHGGDLAGGGSSPAEVVDRIRELGWQGVAGNADEMLWSPSALTAFADQSPGLQALFTAIEETAAATREALGEERIAWLQRLPRVQLHDRFALVHASPEDLWRAPGSEASDAELESVFSALGRPIAVFAHIHRPFIRSVSEMVVINTGSVSLSYDGDPRAAYLLLDDWAPSIRRVEYDVDREVKALHARAFPHADWIEKDLRSASASIP